jgi:hypothetical protein
VAKSKLPRGTYEEIKILALAAVENPDLEYFERQVCRSFSTTFHVSILEAETLTIEYMLQHIYEYRFEQQKLGDRVDEARELLKSPDERKEEEEQELRRLDEDEAYLVRESLKLKSPKPKSKPVVKAPPLPDPLPDLPTLKFDSEEIPK